jgi:hypothetical protein
MNSPQTYILLIWCCYNHTKVCNIHHVNQWTMSLNINHPYLDQCLPSFCSHVLNYSNCKCANWVLQALLKPGLVPKCDIYCLKNKCCYTYSNSILVALCDPFHMNYSETLSYPTNHDPLPYPSCHIIPINQIC